MIKKKKIKQFLFRLTVINVVYFLVRLTVLQGEEKRVILFSGSDIINYVSAFFLFMLTWEINDWLLKHLKDELEFKNSLRIIGINLGIVIPICALVYYIVCFSPIEYKEIIHENPLGEFYSDFLRSVLLVIAIIFFNMFHFSMNKGNEMKKKVEDLQREMLVSKYNSLKNQISPHFLFNSLNTLTSLMYEDRDLASDFVTRLATSYRYILDHREQDLVSLQKEIGFLDVFIFMMNVRHKDAIVIKSNINVPVDRFVIPTLSLQMLIENALKHNYFSKEKPLQIQISTIDNNALSVINSSNKRFLKEETTKMGLKNIKKRYSYYSNKKVIVRDGEQSFEVIIPLLDKGINKINLIAAS